ncbi:MAG: YggS family pyridoxal phosphate-dependent enzyme [Lachnospiraceae bacterium]
MVKENLAMVEDRVKAACDRAGRSYGSVTLIAVSKTKPVRLVEQAYEYGIRQFGENKAQEMKEKYDMLPKNIEWHFIGHLQTNKIKYVLGRAALIHSVDSLHLAEAIEAECVKKGLEADVLVEVNVAQEETKSGIRTEEAEGLIRDIARLPHVHVKGLMTIAPFVENAGNNRMIFRTLKELSVDIAGKNIDNVSMNILSMGMTNDYEVAIEEGATHIRVGTAVFGERNIAI